MARPWTRWSALSLLAAACGESQVSQGNRPPEMQAPAAQLVVEGQLLQFSVSASDLDDDAIVLAADTLPEGASFDPQSGQFSWMPTRKQAGNYAVGFSASDSRFTVQQSVAIVVVDQNRLPELDALSDASVIEGQLLSLVVRGSDPDDDAVTIEALQLPRGASFDAQASRLSWRPGYDQAGTYSVVFIVTDAGSPPLSARGTLVARVENYVESIIVTDFPIEGTLGDGSASSELTARTGVVLDFSAETDMSPTIAEMKISNLPSMGDSSWQPFDPKVEWLVPPGDGSKTVYARFRDNAENVSGLAEGTIDLDTTPPLPASANLVGPAVTREEAVTLALLAQDRSGLHPTQAVAVSEDFDFDDDGTLGPQAFPGSSQVEFSLSAGDGAKMVYVRLRDVAVNDALATVRVVRDTAPPDGGSVTIVSPTDNGFTNSVSVVVQIRYPPDAVEVILAAAADAESCDDEDLIGKIPQPVAPAAQFLLRAGDGLKKVCGRLLDAAGNPSAFVWGTIVLDTTPPTAPVIVTPGQTLNLADGATFTVQTAEAVNDTNFERYQQLGGKATGWTDGSTSINTTSFDFALASSSIAAARVPNLLRLRAVDKAANAGPEASVIITTDIVKPAPVTLSEFWVDNRDSKALVYWQPSPSADVAYYRVYYGLSSGTSTGAYDGTLAGNGPSPVNVGSVTRVLLYDLPNEIITYATVRPVDFAGNEGGVSGTSWVSLQPNKVSPNLVATLPLSSSFSYKGIRKLAVYGQYLYVFGHTANYSAASSVLQVVDLSSIVSQIRGGTINTSAPKPIAGTTFENTDGIYVYQGSTKSSEDMFLDAPYLYTAGGRKVRIWSLRDPAAPVALAELDLGEGVRAEGLTVLADKLFVQERAWGGLNAIAVDLGKLYDGDPGTLPSMTDLIGRANGGCGGYGAGLAWTRDRLVGTQSSDSLCHWRLADALDGDTATIWDASDLIAGPTVFMEDIRHPRISGNHLYLANGEQFAMFDLTPLWAGSPLSATPLGKVALGGTYQAAQFDVQGPLAFVGAGNNLRVLRLSEQGINTVGAYSATNGMAYLTYGPYLLVAAEKQLQVFEIATPSALRAVVNVPLGQHAGRPFVSGGFLHTSGPAVVDLQAENAPLVASNRQSCHRAGVLVDDTMVVAGEAGGAVLVFYDQSRAVDRDTVTNDLSAVTVTMPENVFVTGIDAVGNYLVLAENRYGPPGPPGPLGTWLEVFDVRKIRAGRATSFSLAEDVKGSFLVNTYTARAEVSMHLGRALVAIGDESSGGNGRLHVVDLRPLMDDDDASTEGVAILGSGFVGAPAVAVVGRGNHAYVALADEKITGDGGLAVVDISAAMTQPPPSTPVSLVRGAYLSLSPIGGLTVHGSYLLAAGRDGVTLVDVAVPLVPKVLSRAGFGRSERCADTTKNMFVRYGVTVAGSRAYATPAGALQVFELE